MFMYHNYQNKKLNNVMMHKKKFQVDEYMNKPYVIYHLEFVKCHIVQQKLLV